MLAFLHLALLCHLVTRIEPPDPPIPYPHPLITEVLYAVPRDAGDANHDGVRDAAGDEFVELINPHERPINLKGYALRDSGEGKSQFKFIFPAFELGPGEIVVVFNGFEATMTGPTGTSKSAPNEPHPEFHRAWVFSAGMSSGKASLANASDYVALVAPNGSVVACVWWGKERNPPRAILSEEAPAVMRGSVQRALTGPEDVPPNDPGDTDAPREDVTPLTNTPETSTTKSAGRSKSADGNADDGDDESSPESSPKNQGNDERPGDQPADQPVEEHDDSMIDTESPEPEKSAAPSTPAGSKADEPPKRSSSEPKSPREKRTSGGGTNEPRARPATTSGPSTKGGPARVVERPKVYREFIAHPVMPQQLAGRVPDAEDEGTGVRFSPGVFFLTPIGESSAPPADSSDARKNQSGDAGPTKSPKDTPKPAGDSHRNRGEPR
jgi:Lamin Tail Domain